MNPLDKQIKSVNINLFGNDIFNEKIDLKRGLNIISGVNGTGKTEFIKKLKAGNDVLLFNDTVVNSSTLPIFAISPKRMVDSKTIEAIAQEYKTKNKSKKQWEAFIKNLQIKSSGFDPYPPFPELFVQTYEDKVDTESKTKPVAVKETKDDFNKVLQMVFPNYKIIAEWIVDKSLNQGRLALGVQKFDLEPLNHEQLSTGEREVLALIFSIYSAKDYEDIILIDEPEIHLNWNLERGLFLFLEWFCESFHKQIIVTTHSRIIFDNKFLNKVLYFVWRKKRIKIENDLPENEKSQIAGEAIQTLSLVFSPSSKTFIVEDRAHETIVSAIANTLKKKVEIVVANGKANVEMFYELSKKQSWRNIFFLVDGDNQGVKYIEKNFIQLKKYCVQNYFLNIEVLAAISGRTKDEVKNTVMESLKKLPDSNNYLPFKKLSELTDINRFPFEMLDALDADRIIKEVFFALGLGKDFDKVSKAYINKSKDISKLKEIFSEITNKL